MLALLVLNLPLAGCDEEAEPEGSVTPGGQTVPPVPDGMVDPKTAPMPPDTRPMNEPTPALRGQIFFQGAPEWSPGFDPAPVTYVLDLASSQANIIQRHDLLDVSADGRELIYSEYDFDTDGIILSLADRNGTVNREIGPLPGGLINVRFSPDGQRIAALVGHAAPARLIMFAKNGTDPQTPLDTSISGFEFLRDGRMLLTYGNSLYIFDQSQGTVTGLAELDEPPRNIAPSPDGKHLALELGNHELLENQVWVYDFVGTDRLGLPRQLTKQPGNNGTPEWSPDSSLLAFRSGLVYAGSSVPGKGCPTLWVIDPNVTAPATPGIDAAARPVPRRDNRGNLVSPSCAAYPVYWR